MSFSVNDKPKDFFDFDKLYQSPVKCLVCGRNHFPDDDSFITIYGNITIGIQGGIIGNNFLDDGKLKRVTYICHKIDCILRGMELSR